MEDGPEPAPSPDPAPAPAGDERSPGAPASAAVEDPTPGPEDPGPRPPSAKRASPPPNAGRPSPPPEETEIRAEVDEPGPEDDEPPEVAEPAGGGADELSCEIFDLLRDFVFQPLRGALAAWRAAPGPGARLRCLSPGRLLDDVLDRVEQLPRRAVRLLRRSGAGPLTLNDDELRRDLFRRVQPMIDAWEECADACRAARRRGAVRQEEAVAYDGAVEDATRPQEPRDPTLALPPLGLPGLIGRPLGARFAPEGPQEAGDRSLLAGYHAALGEALRSSERAWLDAYGALVTAIGAASGPTLCPPAAQATRWEEALAQVERSRRACAGDDSRAALSAAEAARAALPFEASLAAWALRVALDRQNTPACREYCEILQEDFPEDADALEARVEGLVWLGHEERAVDELEDGLRRHRDSRRLRGRQAALLADLGRAADALPLARELAARYPDSAEQQLVLARVLGLAGRRAEAERALGAYVRLADPDEATLASLRAERAFRGLAGARRRTAPPVEVDPHALAEELFDPTAEAFFLAEDLPADVARRARTKWLHLQPKEDLVFFIDTSRRGRGGAGVAVTNERVLWREGLGGTEAVDLQDLTLADVRRVQGGVDLAGHVVGLGKHGHLAQPLLQFLSALARANG